MKLTCYGRAILRIEAGAAKIPIDPFRSDNPSSLAEEWIGCGECEDSARRGGS
jgi:L-ascorbate metabolism protein UlaG (beta-lactamase superfamily)